MHAGNSLNHGICRTRRNARECDAHANVIQLQAPRRSTARSQRPFRDLNRSQTPTKIFLPSGAPRGVRTDSTTMPTCPDGSAARPLDGTDRAPIEASFGVIDASRASVASCSPRIASAMPAAIRRHPASWSTRGCPDRTRRAGVACARFAGLQAAQSGSRLPGRVMHAALRFPCMPPVIACRQDGIVARRRRPALHRRRSSPAPSRPGLRPHRALTPLPIDRGIARVPQTKTGRNARPVVRMTLAMRRRQSSSFSSSSA